MTATAPLGGLRVLELAEGVAGPYAGRLLAMLGATVFKLEPPDGDPARHQPVDGAPLRGTSPLFLHLNAGKRSLRAERVDLDSALGRVDAVLASRVRAQLSGTRLDPERLGPDDPPLVTVNAWGFEAETPGDIADELVVQARSGAIHATGDPGGEPLRFPGWQAQYFAGAHAAVALLFALRGCIRHVDVPWLACLATGVEANFARYLQAGRLEKPAGAHPSAFFPSGAFACRDGHVVPGSIRPADWRAQCAVYGRADLEERYARQSLRAQHHAELMAELAPWYAARGKREIFESALGAGWAAGMVLTSRDALADPHLRERGFLAEHRAPEGWFRAPVRPFRAAGLPVAPGPVPALGEAAELPPRAGPPAPGRGPLSGVRIIELTVAWAGPFVGRTLGALGAEIVKVEAARYFDGWRGNPRFREALSQVPDGRDPEARSQDIAPNFNALNRNKRGLALDLATPEGRQVLLRLVERADVVVANFAQRVLPKLGLDYAALCQANPRVILVSMPALGVDGPYRAAAGYGSIIEGMGGFAARFGARDEGARVSQTFFPDPVAGVHGALAVLAALERRERTGQGSAVDLSQQEVLWLQLGEGLVLASQQDRDPGRLGNREPGAARSGCVRAGDGRWVAFVSAAEAPLPEPGDAPSAEALVAELERRGARAAVVQNFAEAAGDPALRDFVESLAHPVTGPQSYLRVPFRLEGVPLDSRGPAPTFGQHTHDVLREWLDASPGEIAGWEKAGTIGGTPDYDRAVRRAPRT